MPQPGRIHREPVGDVWLKLLRLSDVIDSAKEDTLSDCGEIGILAELNIVSSIMDAPVAMTETAAMYLPNVSLPRHSKAMVWSDSTLGQSEKI